MRKFKLLANFAVAVFVVFGIYIQIMESLGALNPEFGYDFFDLDGVGKILVVLLNLSVFTTIFVAAKHAWDRGKYVWMLLNMLFFPAVYYLNFMYTREEDEPSFKDITRKLNK